MDKNLPPLTRPTDDLSRQELSIANFSAGCSWFRLHRAEYPAMFFGQTGEGRFDSPQAGFGVLYLAENVAGAFVEVFCRQSIRAVPEKKLNAHHLAQLWANRTLNLVDLTGSGPIRMGLGDARIASGDYTVARQWSQAFHDHPKQPDGLLYRSRHDPEQCLAAIFNRTKPIWRNQPLGTMTDYLGQSDFFSLLDRYDFGILS